MKNDIVSPLQLAESLSEYWSPKVISEVDNSYVKVAKLKGSLVWHDHPNEDELFFILKGSLVIEYEEKRIQLRAGDMHVVPKGMKHNPVAEEECLVMLVEKKSTLHTGNLKTPESRSIDEQLGRI